jgi:HEAT repeat protein
MSSTTKHLIETLGAPKEQREEAQRALIERGKEVVSDLAEAVAKHPERDVRAGAALCLGRMGAVEAAGLLCAVASSDKTDASLRPLVLRAVCDLAGPDAPEVVKRTLLAHLDAEDIFTRALACTGLGRIGTDQDQECIEALQRAREDPEDWVREAASKALERLSTTATEPEPDPGPKPPKAQASEQALIPAAQALASIARQLGSPDLAARRQALATLAERGEEAVQAVKPLLDNRLSPGRIGAIEVLGAVGAPEGIDLLAPLLDEEGASDLLPAVLHAMARILARNRDRVGAFPKDQVSVFLDDPDDLVRAAAHAAMVAAGPTERRAAVEACLAGEEDEWVLASLAKTLSEVTGPQDRGVVKQLVDLLARLTEADSQLHLIRALERVLSDPVPDDARLVGSLSYFLHVEDRAVRLAAARLICRVAYDTRVDPATQTGLLDLLPVAESSPDKLLLIRSIGRFARGEDQAAVEAMSGLLHGEDQEVAREAARALAQLGSESAVDLLVGAANSQQGAVVTIAAQQLAAMDPKSRVIGVRRPDGRWERKIQHWCECGGALTWVSRGARQELRCPQCDREFVVSSAGKLFRADRIPLGVCLCQECKRKQPLIRRGDSDTLICPVTGQIHIRPFDHPRQIKLLTELPLGACRCCAEPQPLIRVDEQVICYRTRRQHRAAARGFVLEGEGAGAGAQTEGEIAAINQALLEGTIGIGQSGVAVRRPREDEPEEPER